MRLNHYPTSTCENAGNDSPSMARSSQLHGSTEPVLSTLSLGATMTTTSRLSTVKNETLPNDVVELEAAVAQLPADVRAQFGPLVNRVVESTWRRRRILSLVQEALSQLRLDMKYLMFDLEATRRERDSFQLELSQGQQEEFEYDEFDPGEDDEIDE